MKRTSLPFLVVSALAVATISTTGCTGNRGGKKTDEVAASDEKHGAGGKVITMDDVDDKLNAKVQGERFRVTYNADDPFHGADSPLVTIVEFSDFQCPFCSKFADMLSEVQKDPAYAKDVRVVFKQFPLPMHKDAGMGSEAALAAGKQGKFWEMHDILFKNQKAMTRADVEKYGEQLGLDMAAFKAELDKQVNKAKVDADLAMGKQFGVRGTPSFFINGKWQRGAPRAIEGLKKLIDEEKALAEQLIKDGSARDEIYARIMKAAKDKRVEPPQENKPRPGQPDPAVNYAVPVDGRPAYGPEDALVTIVEYSDFQCPFCSRVNPTMKQIKETYPKDVRIVFRQLPLGFHDRARPAAKAALAAAQQGKFWEMHDALFANQKALDDKSLETYASQIAGLNLDQWKKDLADPKLETLVKEDETIAAKFGAGGTPGVLRQRPVPLGRPAVRGLRHADQGGEGQGREVPGRQQGRQEGPVRGDAQDLGDRAQGPAAAAGRRLQAPRRADQGPGRQGQRQEPEGHDRRVLGLRLPVLQEGRRHGRADRQGVRRQGRDLLPQLPAADAQDGRAGPPRRHRRAEPGQVLGDA
jgi:protein-disulfide isomerase